jgi:hypothetical protein
MMELLVMVALAVQHDTLPPHGTIAGVVTDQSSRPIQRAVVQVLPGPKEVLTGRSGDFRFTDREAGLHVVIVSAMGYRRQMMQVELSPGTGWRGQIKLALMVHELPEVVSTVRSWKPAEYAGTSRYDGYFMRQRLGFGKFISRDDIDRLAPIHFTQILQRVPGFRVNYTPPGTAQPPTSIKITRCTTDNPPKVAIYIDGVRLRSGPSELSEGTGVALDGRARRRAGFMKPTEAFAELLDSINPRDIEMMEVYSGVAQIPADFDRDVCAVIAVWTRWNRG